jgi:hypothetical protein
VGGGGGGSKNGRRGRGARILTVRGFRCTYELLYHLSLIFYSIIKSRSTYVYDTVVLQYHIRITYPTVR